MLQRTDGEVLSESRNRNNNNNINAVITSPSECLPRRGVRPSKVRNLTWAPAFAVLPTSDSMALARSGTSEHTGTLLPCAVQTPSGVRGWFAGAAP